MKAMNLIATVAVLCAIVSVSMAADIFFSRDELPAVEVLKQEFHPGDRERFVQVDSAVWTAFLQQQPGFVSKVNLIPNNDTIANTTIYQLIHWSSYGLWKNITWQEMQPVQAQFVAELGYTPTLTPAPGDGNGFLLENYTGGVIEGSSMQEAFGGSDNGNVDTFEGPAVEIDMLNYHPGDQLRLMMNDHATYTAYLRKQPGFGSKHYLVPRNETLANTMLYVYIHWRSFKLWQFITPQDEAPSQAKFEMLMGYDPPFSFVPPGSQGFSPQNFTQGSNRSMLFVV